MNHEPVFNTEPIPVDKISKNLSTHIITTNEDKLRLILERYEDKVSNKSKPVTYASIALTLMISLLTSDFKSFLTINAEVWKGVFIISSIIFSVLFFYFLFKDKPPSVNDLIDEISGKN